MQRVVAIVVAAAAVVMILLTGQIWQNVDADEIVVIQSPVSGDLTWHTTPGLKWQGLGKVTTYHKRSIYSFDAKMRFNDGAHGTMKGSIQYELPTDEHNLTAIHVRFGSQAAVQAQLVETVVNKAIYMTGPLMSSKESYAERRNALISYVEDQVERGVYQTRQSDVRERDPVTGVDKTVTKVEIIVEGGAPKRQEEAVLTSFGIKPFNFSIGSLDYDQAVEQQIAAQQQATMDVQTAMAEAKKAEQRALTVEQQGRAEAMKAKWQQETEKAREVTKAEQEKSVAVTAAQKALEVARLEAEASEQYRISQLRRAEGDAGYKKQVLAADGALAQKLETFERVQMGWANAFAQRKVPATVLGGGAGAPGGDGDVQALLQLLTAQTAKSIALDMAVPARE